MKSVHYPGRRGAFTLVEMLIVMAVIALLAGLTMSGYTYAMRGSKEKTTRGTFEAVKNALENYKSEFGEFPEPVQPEQQVEFSIGKTYNIGGAACLYQALSGDGFDQIKGVTAPSSAEEASAASNGKIEGQTEIKANMLKEMPQTMWIRKNGVYLLVDAFAHPFQYTKAASPTTTSGGAAAPKPITINSTYDLWSYSMDETNTTKKSVDTLQTPGIAIKWIKNW